MEMKKSTLMWIVIGILFLLALFLMFKAGASGSMAQSVSGTAKSLASSSAMVGGC